MLKPTVALGQVGLPVSTYFSAVKMRWPEHNAVSDSNRE